MYIKELYVVSADYNMGTLTKTVSKYWRNCAIYTTAEPTYGPDRQWSAPKRPDMVWHSGYQAGWIHHQTYHQSPQNRLDKMIEQRVSTMDIEQRR